MIPNCDREASICEFSFTLSNNITMMYFPDGKRGVMRPVVIDEDGKMKAKRKGCDTVDYLSNKGKLNYIFILLKSLFVCHSTSVF